MKPGYKKTEVGVIPKEWDVDLFENVTDLITCGIAATPVYVSESGGYPFLSSTNIKEGRIVWAEYKHIGAVLHHQLYRNNPPKRGDILYSRVGTIGEAAIIDVDFAFSIYVSLTLIKPKKYLDSSFLMQLLNSAPYKKRAKDQVYLGGGVGNLNVEVVRKYPIIVPQLAEQRAIAAALSDVDSLISGLDQFITKKRDMKQATMQHLLTGRQRLPGFSGKWAVKQLGDLGIFSKGKGIRKDDVVAEGFPCIRYGEIYTKHSDYIRKFYSFIPARVAKESQLLSRGDLLFAGSGETAEEIGKCVAFLGDEEAYAGGDIVIFTPINQNSMYLGYLMNHSSISSQKARMGQGDAVVHISAKNLGDMKLNIPPLEEQIAIATVLSDMDAEIAALEQKREKTRALKQGMMQELLTGRIRII